MLKSIRLLIALAIALIWSGTAWADAQQQTQPQWTASYWNNVGLTGNPVLTRQENNVNYDWGFGSPAPAVEADRFSARWTTTTNLPAGRYRFDVVTDDGARLYVNGALIIDEWHVQAARGYSAEINLPGGFIPIELQYFENGGLATIRLDWTPLDTTFEGWRAEYYDNRTLSGAPAVVRDDPRINFVWGEGSPAGDVLDPDAFSARWTRSLNLAAGTYEFRMTVDDGGRLRVNNQLLIDQFFPQPATTYTARITVPAGDVPVEMEYFENGGVAVARLEWTRVTQPPVPDPTPGTVIDNVSPSFVRGGPDSGWHTEGEGFDGSLFWSWNSRSAASDYNWAVWYPDLEPGIYRVEAYIPERFTTTSQARYWVSHTNGFNLTQVDQSVNGSQWVTLGTFQFSGTSDDYVSLADVTFEPEASRLVAYDAVRFTRAGSRDADASVVLDRQVASPGTRVTASGAGFPPGRTIYLRVGPPNTEPFGQYDQSIVRPDGTATLSFVVPETWPDGRQIIADQLVVLLISQDGTSGTADFQYVDPGR